MDEAARSRGFGAAAFASLIAGAVCTGDVIAAAIATTSNGHFGHPLFANVYNPLDGFKVLGALDMHCIAQPLIRHISHQHSTICATSPAVISALNTKAAWWAAVTGAVPFFGFKYAERSLLKATSLGRKLPRVKRGPGHVVIDLGRSSGKLAARGLTEAGLRPNQTVSIADDDLCLNTIIFGEIGSGKTVSGMVPFIHAALAQDCGAVIGSGKGNIHRTVLRLGEMTEREVRVIGFGRESEGVDLCADMTPDTAKGYLSSLLRMQDQGKDSGTWINAAVNLSRGVLGVLKMHEEAYPEARSHFSYPGMHKFLYGRAGLKELIEDKLEAKVKDWSAEFDNASGDERDRIARQLNDIESYQNELESYKSTTAGIKSSVDHALRQVLSQLATPAMEEAFFNKKPRSRHQQQFSFDQTYNDGAIFVIHAPEQEIGADTSALIISLVKALFFSSMERRLVDDDANQDRLVGLFIDECFPAGTLVDGQPIESLRVGDYVAAFDEASGSVVQSRITKLFKKPALTLVRISANGKSVVSTPNHPFWTLEGWKPASELRVGDYVFHVSESGRHDQHAPTHAVSEIGSDLLFGEVWPCIHGIKVRTQDVDGQGTEIVVGSHARGQSHEERGHTLSYGCNTSPRRTCAEEAWRERSRTDGGRVALRDSAWLEPSGRDDSAPAPNGASFQLQSGPWRPGANDSDRSGRGIALHLNASSAGSQENGDITGARVDRLEVLEPGSDRTFGGVCSDGYVYNIEVERFHTYIANDFVVHNCQDYVSGSASGQNSDHTAVAKLRETRAFCVWATQSMNALEVKLGSTMTKALLANFLHKIIFRLKDVTTQKDALELLGDVEVDKESTSTSTGGRTTKSTSKSKQLQLVAKAELFLNLKANQALYVGTINHETATDIITCTPEFIKA